MPAPASRTPAAPSATSAGSCGSPRTSRTPSSKKYLGGGQRTAGGILRAVTSAAQLEDDADTAYEMERVALRAMALAVTHQR